jgi:hypothetical protein
VRNKRSSHDICRTLRRGADLLADLLFRFAVVFPPLRAAVAIIPALL